MKRIVLGLFTAILCCHLSAADMLTLDLSEVIDNYPQTQDGCWEDTYIDGAIDAGIFRLAHTGSSDGGGGMAYWEGFTVCTSGDNTDYGAQGSSDGWIAHQWGCMAGGGADEEGNAVPGAPYLVAYWGFYMESQDATYHSLRVDFTDEQPHKCVGTWICNHPWPYYGNLNGDGFASAFVNDGDYFALVAHGLNELGEPTGSTAKLMLATYSDGELHQSSEWQYMDLQSLGTVHGLYFTMETSDVDALYGANTAVYFCMDRLSVLEAEDEQPLIRPSGLKVVSAGEDSITICWNKVSGADGYNMYMGDEPAGRTADTCYTFHELDAYTSYTLRVAAVRGDDVSETASITARTTDETAPTKPNNLQAAADIHSITLTWQPAEDNVEVKRYTVFVNNEAYKRLTANTCTIVGLDAGIEYLLEVEAEDLAGNKSERAAIRVNTLCETALEDIHSENTIIGVFTIDGRYVGRTIPTSPGIYVLKQKINQTTIIQ